MIMHPSQRRRRIYWLWRSEERENLFPLGWSHVAKKAGSDWCGVQSCHKVWGWCWVERVVCELPYYYNCCLLSLSERRLYCSCIARDEKKGVLGLGGPRRTFLFFYRLDLVRPLFRPGSVERILNTCKSDFFPFLLVVLWLVGWLVGRGGGGREHGRGEGGWICLSTRNKKEEVVEMRYM